MKSPEMLQKIVAFVFKLRPAPLAVLVGTLMGLGRRREYKTSAGLLWLSPLSDLGNRIICQGSYEPRMELLLRSCLSEGKIFVDLGANEGYFSILASKLVGKSGNVIAVEPQSRLIPILQKNIHINACDNVRIIRGLVSSRTGSKPIHLAPLTNTGSSSIYRPTKYALPVEIVPSFTLDGIFKLANLKRCDLLKIDVEGAEGEIINGARNNLRSMNIKMIVVEFHKEALAKAKWSQEDINEQIVRSGYRADPCGDFVVYRSFNSADC